MDYTYHYGASMKSNMPVTQIEHALNDKATLLSTTDKEVILPTLTLLLSMPADLTKIN